MNILHTMCVYTLHVCVRVCVCVEGKSKCSEFTLGTAELHLRGLLSVTVLNFEDLTEQM